MKKEYFSLFKSSMQIDFIYNILFQIIFHLYTLVQILNFLIHKIFPFMIFFFLSIHLKIIFNSDMNIILEKLNKLKK